jgi:DNA-binding CsgD family transcriptional regulator
MRRVPQQPEERFEAVLREQHKRARHFDDELRSLTAYFRENPSMHALALLFLVPRQMDVWQQEALARFGYDLENRKMRTEFAIDTIQEALELFRLMTHYYTYDRAMEHWAALADNGLSGEQQAMKVCAAFIEAYSERPGLAAYGVELVEAGLPDRLKGLLLSTYLTGYLATHTSLHSNYRLRHSIDKLREVGESRFTRLLKELSAEALAAYRDKPRNFGNLMDIRTETARRLEKRDAPPDLQDLANFADRENLLTQAKAARLSPQELEVFKLCTEKPTLKYREIGAQLGISTSQVGVIKHRIKHKLAASL